MRKRRPGFGHRAERLELRLALSAVGFVEHELSPLDPFPTQIAAFDVDDDGDLDLLADYDGQLVWHDNTDGLATFSSEKEIGTTNGSRFELADLDGDGLTDILAGNVWLRNLGDGNFAASKLIPTATSDLTQSADLDGDGDLDLVSRDAVGQTLSWLENIDGMGRFEHRETIELPTASITLADINGDGLSDVSSLSSDEAKWFENSAVNGPFGIAHPVPTGSNDIESLFPVDWDGDQDIDFISVSRHSKATSDTRQTDIDLIQFHENDGTGVFAPREALADRPWQDYGYQLEDIDGDDDLDIVFLWQTLFDVSVFLGLENQAGTIPDDAISGLMGGDENYAGYTFADFNSDGKPEHAFSSLQWSGIGWFDFGNAPPMRVSTPTNTFGAGRAQFFDVDQDNVRDIVFQRGWGRGAGPQGWFRQTENGKFEEPQPHAGMLPFVGDRLYVDFDGDGDLDFVDRRIGDRWFELDGTDHHPRAIDGFESVPQFLAVEDLDGDGDVDIVARSGRKLSWSENLDGMGNFDSERVLLESASSLFYALDVELDGDTDIVFEKGRGNYYWLENNGNGEFAAESNVNFEEVSRWVYGDIDGDEFVDHLVAMGENSIVWQRELSARFVLTTDPFRRNFEHQFGVDFDADGDTDVLGIRDGVFSWRENVDGILQESREFIHDAKAENWSFGDVDADGDLDVISAAYGRVTWHENRLMGDANDDGKVDFEDFLKLSANYGAVDAVWESGDFTGDGEVSFSDFLVLSDNFGKFR